MTLDPRQRNEIDRLLETLRDGELNDAEADYLESLLTQSTELRRYYVQAVGLQIGLRRLSAGPIRKEQILPVAVFLDLGKGLTTQPPAPLLQGETGAPQTATSLSTEAFSAQAPADVPVAAKPLKSPPSVLERPLVPGNTGRGLLGSAARSWETLSRHALLFSAIAALVAISTLLAWHMRPASRPAQPAEVAAGGAGAGLPTLAPSVTIASLTRAAHCRWIDPNRTRQPGDRLAVGQQLDLAGGVVELRFDRGVRVVLQGPARLELTSAAAIRLQAGKMTAEILRPEARGFQVQTPKGYVVDLGTEFGVEVTPGDDVQVHVFQGEVVVEQAAGATGPAGMSDSHAASLKTELRRNQGLRMESGAARPLLVEGPGETYIRSIDDADRDMHVVAYWRFEDHPVGAVVPDTSRDTKPVRGTVDSSFNGNDLFTFCPATRPAFSADLPADSLLQSGAPNRGCLDNTAPPDGMPTRDLYTRSRVSHAAPIDIQTMTPAQWTIEASVKAKVLHAERQTFVGREGGKGGMRLALRVNEQDRFEIMYYDVKHRKHTTVADLKVRDNHWYHVAAVSNGQTLRLFVDSRDGQGYQLLGITKLDPSHGSTALGMSNPNAIWTVGRGGATRSASEWFRGWIDEVRISDVARNPEDLLFAAKSADKTDKADKVAD